MHYKKYELGITIGRQRRDRLDRFMSVKVFARKECLDKISNSAKVIRKKLELTVRFNPQGREARKLKRLFIIKMSWEKKKMYVDVPLLTEHCREEDMTVMVAAYLELMHRGGRQGTSQSRHIVSKDSCNGGCEEVNANSTLLIRKKLELTVFLILKAVKLGN